MSRKHNVKHNRTKSNYPKRLERRGLSRAPVMPELDTLRRKQGAKDEQRGKEA